MNKVHSLTHAGYTINIYQDEDPEDPRNFDNLGIMVCWHSRYYLGDCGGERRKIREGFPFFADPQDFQQWWEEHGKGGICLGLSLLDHSGLHMYLGHGAHACDSGGWDSGPIGYIYVTAERIRKEYSCKRITKQVREKATKVLESEVAIYDMYLRNDVYGYQVMDEDGHNIDSCWGFYGYGKGEDSSWEYMLDQAKEAAESAAKNNAVAGGI